MPSVIAFGAGNVGRGFIGDIFTDSGWSVTFLDVAPVLVDTLHRERSYIHETVSNIGVTARTVTGIDARYSTDQEEVDRLVTGADVITTSVGARILPLIAPALAHGLAARWGAGRGPVDVLLCENLHGAADVVRELVLECLPTEFADSLDENLGLAETSIGRMIPAALPADGQPPTLIRAEPYRHLPYDATALHGVEPAVTGLVAVHDVPFDFYTDRKLLIHNMGHCTCAYLGESLGYKYMWQAIADPRIRSIVAGAMGESALALTRHYGADPMPVARHIDDLLARFGNRALGDTTERVGRDPVRKLSPDDRLIGAYRLARDAGAPREYLSLAVALGTRRLAAEDGWSLDSAIVRVEDALFTDSSTGKGSDRGTDPARHLYRAQVEALADGFDWSEQMELIDRSELRGDIV